MLPIWSVRFNIITCSIRPSHLGSRLSHHPFCPAPLSFCHASTQDHYPSCLYHQIICRLSFIIYQIICHLSFIKSDVVCRLSFIKSYVVCPGACCASACERLGRLTPGSSHLSNHMSFVVYPLSNHMSFAIYQIRGRLSFIIYQIICRLSFIKSDVVLPLSS